MEINVDWDNIEKQIRSSYRMTDGEVDQCLLALSHAKEIYQKKNRYTRTD